MNGHKNAATVLEHHDGGTSYQVNCDTVVLPVSSDSTMPTDEKQHPLQDMLHYGAENATSARDLAALLGCSMRDISRAVQQLRLSSIPICGGTDGYFLPADEAELQRYCKSLNHRVREVRRTAEAMDDALCHMTGQEIVAGWGESVDSQG